MDDISGKLHKMNYVYMIRDEKNNLYIGITKNPNQRAVYHNSSRGALFTKRSTTFSIVFLEECLTLSAARKREIQIKKWSRVKKENLIKLYEQNIDNRT